jgi:serine/threonine-protein kinase
MNADALFDALSDRYKLVRELGAGGMATVYLAEDLKHSRPVAVKVLRSELGSALGRERFPREIEIIAQLSHPHILPMHDSGEAAGFLYYVMPYLEGETLRQRLQREGALPITDSLRFLREIVDALAFAHSRGVIHRDIKPENVMLSGRHAIVMDFGIAKAVSAAGGEQLTTVGIALGTPTYMAPEQATGETDVDHRADLYAMTCSSVMPARSSPSASTSRFTTLGITSSLFAVQGLVLKTPLKLTRGNERMLICVLRWRSRVLRQA